MCRLSMVVCCMQLFAHITVNSSQTGQVVVLTSVGIGSYISDVAPGDLPTSFLRSLTTRCFSDTPIAAVLEQPNLVSGLPAQGMSDLVVFCCWLPIQQTNCCYFYRLAALRCRALY